MAIWSKGQRVADPEAASFRAEVEQAVEVMTNHRLTDARKALREARRTIGQMEPHPARTLAFDVLVDVDRILGGAS